MILRDDHVAASDAAADSTLERRVYYVQNWRSDVVALMRDNGRVVERAWYEPYGVPHGLPGKDLTTTNTSGNDDYGVPDGSTDLNDQLYFNTLHGGSSPRADVSGSTSGGDFAPHAGWGRPNGTLDSDDSTYWSGLSAQPAMGRKKLSSYTNASDLRNRKGLAGYEWDPSIRKYHVRNRVLDPEVGRWTRRDPLGYVDGASLYEYARSRFSSTDALGLACAPGHIGVASNCGGPPFLPPSRKKEPWQQQCENTVAQCLAQPDVKAIYDSVVHACNGRTPNIICANGPACGGDGNRQTHAYVCCARPRTVVVCPSALQHNTCMQLKHELIHVRQFCQAPIECMKKPGLWGPIDACAPDVDACTGCCHELKAESEAEYGDLWCALPPNARENWILRNFNRWRRCSACLESFRDPNADPHAPSDHFQPFSDYLMSQCLSCANR